MRDGAEKGHGEKDKGGVTPSLANNTCWGDGEAAVMRRWGTYSFLSTNKLFVSFFFFSSSFFFFSFRLKAK